LVSGIGQTEREINVGPSIFGVGCRRTGNRSATDALVVSRIFEEIRTYMGSLIWSEHSPILKLPFHPETGRL